MPQSERPRQERRPRQARSSRQGSGQGRRPSRQGSGRQHQQQGRRLRGRHDTGYSLQSHNINFRDGRSLPDRRLLLLGGIAIVIVILLLVLVSSCIRGCTSNKDETVDVDQSNARVASGISDTLTNELDSALSDADKLEEIAKNADKYSNESIVQLALREPEAIDFVSKVPTAEKTSQSYTDTVTQGTVPELYDWDERWGFVDYAGLPLGVSGSGPTCMSMAYMGLTGSNDRSPADMASLAADGGYASGDAYTTAEFFSSEAAGIGLYCETPEVSAGVIVASLQNAHPVICLVRADTLTEDSHYVICVSLNEDQTVNVYDPTSSEVAKRPWSAATISSYSEQIFVLHLADNTDADQNTDDENSTDNSSSSNTEDSSSSNSGTSSNSNSGETNTEE